MRSSAQYARGERPTRDAESNEPPVSLGVVACPYLDERISEDDLTSTGVFDHDSPTSTAQFRSWTKHSPVGRSTGDAILHFDFAHFQHASSDNALHRVWAGRRTVDDLPSWLAEYQFDLACP